MKTADKALIGIVAGIVLLIAVALGVTLMRPEPTYLAEDTPKGVAHNYLLALQKEDYARAYGYLSLTLTGHPKSANGFSTHVQNEPWQFRLGQNITLSVETVKISGNNATVTVRELRFWGGELFDSGQSTSTFEMHLRMENNKWKIVSSDYYFARCWNRAEGCE